MAMNPLLPSLLKRQVQVLDRSWSLHISSDLSDAVSETDGAPTSGLIDALEDALCVPVKEPWRLTLDVDSHLLGLAVLPQEGRLHLGSPGFSAERFLLAAADEDEPELEDWRAHVQAWRRASAQAAPLDIERITQRHALTDLLHGEETLRTQRDMIASKMREEAEKVAEAMQAYDPGFLEQITQFGLGLQADYTILRVHALRFIALLPALDYDLAGGDIKRLLLEMMRRVLRDSEQPAKAPHDDKNLPRWLRVLFVIGQSFVRRLPSKWVARWTRSGVRTLARSFIAGENIAEAQPALQALEESGRSATLDQLGELVVRESEADRYCEHVLELVQGCGVAGKEPRLNGAGIPIGHVSVKVSALSAHYDPDDVEGTWSRVGPRLRRIVERARTHGVFINLDAEHYAVRDLTFHMFTRLLGPDSDLRDYPWIGIVVQAYLRDAAAHIEELLSFCQTRGIRVPIRLVKGAYWDEETTKANAHSYDAPQFLNKPETDLLYQQLCLRILRETEVAQLCVGSHNVRDHCFARAAREVLYPEAPPIEHQTLHMTYEALSSAMGRLGWSVRNYVPVGSLLVGMAYFVRRIMENSSQVGVLTKARQGFVLDEALQSPEATLHALQAAGKIARHPTTLSDAEPPPFENVAPVRLHRPHHRAAFQAAIQERRLLSRDEAPIHPFRSGPLHTSRSPSETKEEIGTIRFADSKDVSEAVEAARRAQPAWGACSARHRAAVLIRAAEQMRAGRLHLGVLVALEAGKARTEALADVDEAIDFLQFYAREAVRLESGVERPTLKARGVVAVVAPWNFPIAIPCGMTAAALAAGNAAILKSAEQTPLVSEALVDLLHQAGVPKDVVLHLPGEGPDVGAPLVAHPDVAGCVFTGSKAVGTRIHATLNAHPDAHGGRLVITEMGGKNAMLVTANADLDEAVAGCIYGAFGHAGQKCSAASRVLVDRRIRDLFVERLIGAARDQIVGGSLTPGVQINPVISHEDRERLRQVVREARAEAEAVGGRVLLDLSGAYEDAPGHIVGPALIELPAEAALTTGSSALREHFGPILHIVAFRDLHEAMEQFNATEYALTGGIFSQSLDEIEALVDQAECGNIYVNRSNTGARVAIEPFGGFKMSGTGPKAGGRDYLRSFYRREGLGKDAEPVSVDADVQSMFSEFRKEAVSMRSGRPDNHRIPGQNSHNRLSLPRGPLTALLTGPEITRLPLRHILAALAAGNHAYAGILGGGPTRGEPTQWEAILGRIGALNDVGKRLHVQRIDVETEGQWFKTIAPASVVLQGPLADHEDRLAKLLKDAGDAGHLAAVYGAGDGPSSEDLTGLLRVHLHTRSVAINTMRHGAPLTIDD